MKVRPSVKPICDKCRVIKDVYKRQLPGQMVTEPEAPKNPYNDRRGRRRNDRNDRRGNNRGNRNDNRNANASGSKPAPQAQAGAPATEGGK